MLIKSMFNANPFDVAREMDRLFESMMANQPAAYVPTARGRLSYPAVNLWEDDGSLYIEAELPGLSMDDLEVLVTDNELTIKGERRPTAPENAATLRRERGTGTFERTISLPVDINAENVEAKLHDGVLMITLPKAPAHTPRKIEVKSHSNA